jgi:hypothetical protein
MNIPDLMIEHYREAWQRRFAEVIDAEAARSSLVDLIWLVALVEHPELVHTLGIAGISRRSN